MQIKCCALVCEQLGEESRVDSITLSGNLIKSE